MKIKRKALSLTAKVFLTSWVIALALRYSGIIEHPTIHPWTFVLFAVFALPFIGFALLGLTGSGFRQASRSLHYEGNVDATGRVYVISQLLALSYLFLVIIDLIVLGNVLIVGVTEARDLRAAEGERNSLLGASHYFLAGAPVILACLLLTRRTNAVKSGPFPWVIAVGGFLSYFLSGGRGSFVIGALVVFFYFIIERHKCHVSGRSQNIYMPRWAFVLGGASLVYMVYLFEERAAIRGTDLEGLAQRLMLSYDVYVSAPPISGDLFGGIYYAFVFVVFYITHAPTYISEYFELDYYPLTMGGYEFYILFRIFDFMFGTSLAVEASDKLLLRGVFLTLPGTVFVDFGWTGVIIVAAFLPCITLLMLSRALSSGTGFGMIGASFLLSVIALSPFFSAVTLGNGFSIWFLLVIYSVCKRVGGILALR